MKWPVAILLAALLQIPGGLYAQASAVIAGDYKLIRWYEDGALSIWEEAYPRAFFFRQPEKVYEPYEAWDKNFSRLSGIMGKILDEELKENSRAVEYFRKFKEDHPEQVTLLHLNGNARDPEFETGPFFAGHWLYYAGATILSDIPADTAVIAIKVSDARRFKERSGWDGLRHDDIGLCALGPDGKADWRYSEQVVLQAVDYANNTITIKRAQYGTQPVALKAGRAYAAAHIREGPWGKGGNNPLWYYNFSTRAPKDEQGRQAWEVFADDVARRFLPGGELSFMDGLEFDVLHHELKNHSYAYLDTIRFPDCDNDGRHDWGVFEGVNTYGAGVMQFARRLRQQLGPDKLILADGFALNHQRAFGIFNGIESEGWPRGDDYELEDWPGGVNRHRFWAANAHPPALNYVNHRWWEKKYPEVPHNIQRLVIAGTVLTNSVYSASFYNPDDDNPEDEHWQPLFDEVVKGTENEPFWLGKPLGGTKRLAENEAYRLLWSLSDFYNHLALADGMEAELTENGIRISAEGQDALRFRLEGLPSTGNDLLLLLEMSGAPIAQAPPEYARAVLVGLSEQSVTSEHKHQYMSFLNARPFESEFGFVNAKTGTVNLEFEIEGGEPVLISGIEIYHQPNARARVFENGIVLANPAMGAYTFDLEELSPGVKYFRLQGSAGQDTVVNNGQPAGGQVTLPAKDALFLRRIKGE